MKIKEICSRVVVVAAPETDLREAARLMRDHHVGALVVIEKRDGATRPVGIVTDRDIVVAVVADEGVRPESLALRDVMSGELALAQETDGVFEAVDRMQDSGTRRLPVVDAEGRLVGILSLDDVLRMLASELTALALASQRSVAREARARPVLAGRAA
jgi:CBS domain-containing protein